MSCQDEIRIIGGGLAGAEAAFQIARRGQRVALYEMRPARMTEAHKTSRLAELVCSNSLKSELLTTGSGLLKAELLSLGSVLLGIAQEVRVPAGTALAVDRLKFSERVEEALSREAGIRVVREEVCELEPAQLTIVASGPLTSKSLSEWIARFLGHDSLFFFDAISPIIDSETIDHERTFPASRYDKGSGPYLNCPFTEGEFDNFWEELVKARVADCRAFETGLFFEPCLPVEVVAGRGKMSLAFGALKPVGLVDPHTGRIPHAVVQLRPENVEKTAYGMVGFQTRLKIEEQKRVFRMIPGLERAEFLRYGSVHRNSFIDAPACLLPTLQTRRSPTMFFAGQLSGVEGYVPSIATGLLAGMNVARLAAGRDPVVPPPETAVGSLCRYIASAGVSPFQPMNFNFGLLPPLPRRVRTKLHRKEAAASRAMKAIEEWREITV
ncbi:MAG: methylenetetrahydrofolate--tRNA-(uracil(54)-C(5))-methyltransferase (FADH(2)-oxidizing) TrmFO [Candidatus Eisenbacteria bacterium]|nr:methylenetetrahydrofolate--tRNA-(uracil(54)-C(5))-methyltransferase (FADH(2)-oxidizing) TrmFO [Candidatus Eisenbacteria bacterium]